MTETQNDPWGGEDIVGGGLWDGKTVTITDAKVLSETFKDNDGKQVTQAALRITGIAQDEDRERWESYSAGKKLTPTHDGQGFQSVDGGPAKFHSNSNISKFKAALEASGFDKSTLIVDGKQKVGKLIGARFVFKGVPRRDRDGKIITDGRNGFPKMAFFPAKFLGYATGAAVKANGASAGIIEEKAIAAVTAVLAEGAASKADLVRKLPKQLGGDSDTNAIIGLVLKDDWHKGKGWKFDGLTATL